MRNATSLALARLMGPDFILVDEISRKTPAVWTQVSLQLGCNTIAAGLQVRASPKLRVLGDVLLLNCEHERLTSARNGMDPNCNSLATIRYVECVLDNGHAKMTQIFRESTIGLLLAVIGLIVGLRQHRLRLFIIAILPGLFLITDWRFYLQGRHYVSPSDFAPPTLQLFIDNLDRLPTIGRIALAEITDTGLWSIFWLLVLVAVIYLLTARNFSRLLLAIGVLGPIILCSLTYVFGAWPSYTAHVTSSLPRLLSHVMPAAWLAIGLALSIAKTETEKLESKRG